ncbi:MAG: outer membrane protein OmpA/MotB family [Acidobacteriales bacterium]|nr:outer membrane protein OmpA/MotB family [Terriglobales bacterium]
MNRTLLSIVAAASVIAGAGCATKNHVRNELNPVVNKVNELDDITARNSRDIKDLDTRNQQGISAVNAKSAQADQKAQAAAQRASEAQTLASSTATRAEALTTTVANLDNYRPVAEASVHFGFDKADLSKKAKEALDNLAQEVPKTKGYIVELTGGTDSVGDKNYNYELSQRRAAAVVQYLAQAHDIPAHKIYVIGLGKDKEVAPNNNRDGRAKNRRVDIRLLSNVNGASPSDTSAQAQPQAR